MPKTCLPAPQPFAGSAVLLLDELVCRPNGYHQEHGVQVRLPNDLDEAIGQMTVCFIDR
jgi:hypothetical protein